MDTLFAAKLLEKNCTVDGHKPTEEELAIVAALKDSKAFQNAIRGAMESIPPIFLTPADYAALLTAGLFVGYQTAEAEQAKRRIKIPVPAYEPLL